MKKIRRNKDNNGVILTYSVIHNGFETEHNTLKEAKIMAYEDKDFENKILANKINKLFKRK